MITASAAQLTLLARIEELARELAETREALDTSNALLLRIIPERGGLVSELDTERKAREWLEGTATTWKRKYESACADADAATRGLKADNAALREALQAFVKANSEGNPQGWVGRMFECDKIARAALGTQPPARDCGQPPRSWTVGPVFNECATCGMHKDMHRSRPEPYYCPSPPGGNGHG